MFRFGGDTCVVTRMATIAETPIVFSVDLIKKHRLSSEAGSGDAFTTLSFHLFRRDHSAAISRSMVFEPFSTTTL